MYANMAYYALHKFHWPPSYLLRMNEYERAFVFAAISLKIKADKKAAKEAKKK